MPSTYLTIFFNKTGDTSNGVERALKAVTRAKNDPEKHNLKKALKQLRGCFLGVDKTTPWWKAVKAELTEEKNEAGGVTVSDDGDVAAHFELSFFESQLDSHWLPAMAEAMVAIGLTGVTFTADDDESRYRLNVENGRAGDWEDVGFDEGLHDEVDENSLEQRIVDILDKRSDLRHEEKTPSSEYSLVAIKVLVENGAIPNGKTDWRDPVTQALAFNDIEAIEYFLSLNAIPLDRDLPEFETSDCIHNTALIWVAEKSGDYYEADDGGLAAMRLLLEAGADPNLINNSDGCLPLTKVTAGSGELCLAKVQMLLEFGVDPMCLDEEGETGLGYWKCFAEDESEEDVETYKQCYALLLAAAEQQNNKP